LEHVAVIFSKFSPFKGNRAGIVSQWNSLLAYFIFCTSS
jgi:hypothetical protein